MATRRKSKPLSAWRVVTGDGPEWIRAHYASDEQGELVFYIDTEEGTENLVAAFAPDEWRTCIMAEPEGQKP